MTLFYNQLAEEQKTAIKQNPEKKLEFIEDCRYELKLVFGPPD